MVALAVSGLAALPADAKHPAATSASGLTLRQQVGQLIVVGFEGTSVPSTLVPTLNRGGVSGVILFGHNVSSRSQLRSLTGGLQRAGGGDLLVSVDQEGGEVRRLPWASPRRSEPSQRTEELARSEAVQGARDLRSVGINLNFAPVADVASAPGSIMRKRAFPGGAASVADLTRASIGGWAGSGVAATVKHFPGLGAAHMNTDAAAVTIGRSRSALEQIDLVPFRAAIDAGAPLVMASHALYPALDGRRIASQSKTILTDLLRRQLGFQGVVITDSLAARAVLSRSSIESAAVRSIAAGADMALLTTFRSYQRLYDRLLHAARTSASFRKRVEQSAARVQALKRRLGLT
jgi:beta-N-acetylhexosaminidase